MKSIAGRLNRLLGDYSIFYQNTRNFHWNIQGESFFGLHEKFEGLYNDLASNIDEIAERILTLEHVPEHRYSTYLETSTIKESPAVSDGKEAVTNIIGSLRTLISEQRELFKLANEAEDDGTASLMGDYIRSQEKLIWMYAAFLKS